MQHLKLKTYKGIGEVLTALYKELKRLQPIDSDSISHIQTDSGVISHVKGAHGSKAGHAVVEEMPQQSNASTPYQFKVMDSSSYSVSGSVIKMQVTVSNGNDKDNPIAGYLNKKSYVKTDLVLTSGIDTFYIYAINGEMYALSHQYASDLIPVLLCATVTVANGKLKITQENFENNPEVPLCGESYGSVTLSVQGVVYDSHTLTVKYGCSARALCNNLPIVSGEKSIPATAEGAVGYLIAYVEKLTVENDASPVTGFDFVSGSPTPQVEVEWYREVMSYTLTDTGFRVISRLENPYLFTFTQVFLNAAELGH